MLSRSAKLFIRSFPVLRQNVPLAAIRFQSTVATPEAPANSKNSVKSENDQAEQDRLRREEYKLARRAEFNKVVENIELLFSKKSTSKELYNGLFENISQLKSLNGYSDVPTLSTYIVKLINVSAKETQNPTEGVLPITPEEILEKAIYYRTATEEIFQTVSKYLLNSKDLEGVVSLWVKYLEYSVNNKVRITHYSLRDYTLIAYFELCSVNKSEPNVESLLQLLKINKLPNLYSIRSTINKAVKDEQRKKKLDKLIAGYYLPYSNPLEIKFLVRAAKAAKFRRKDLIDEIWDTVLLTSKNSKIPLTEEIYSNFLKFYLNVNSYKKVEEVWNLLIESKLTPSIDSWNLLLESILINRNLSKEDKIKNSAVIFKKIPEPNDDTFGTLIKIYRILDNLPIIEEIVKEKGLKNSRIFSEYILSIKGDNSLSKILKLIEENDYSNLTIQAYNRILIELMNSQQHSDKVNEIINLVNRKHEESGADKFSLNSRFLAIELKNDLDLIISNGNLPTQELFKNFTDKLARNSVSLRGNPLASIYETLVELNSISTIKYISSNFHSMEDKPKDPDFLFNVDQYEIRSLYELGDNKEGEFKLTRLFQDKKPQNQLRFTFWKPIFETLFKKRQQDKMKIYYHLAKATGGKITDQITPSVATLLGRVARYSNDAKFAQELNDDLKPERAFKLAHYQIRKLVDKTSTETSTENAKTQ